MDIARELENRAREIFNTRYNEDEIGIVQLSVREHELNLIKDEAFKLMEESKEKVAEIVAKKDMDMAEYTAALAESAEIARKMDELTDRIYDEVAAVVRLRHSKTDLYYLLGTQVTDYQETTNDNLSRLTEIEEEISNYENIKNNTNEQSTINFCELRIKELKNESRRLKSQNTRYNKKITKSEEQRAILLNGGPNPFVIEEEHNKEIIPEEQEKEPEEIIPPVVTEEEEIIPPVIDEEEKGPAVIIPPVGGDEEEILPPELPEEDEEEKGPAVIIPPVIPTIGGDEEEEELPEELSEEPEEEEIPEELPEEPEEEEDEEVVAVVKPKERLFTRLQAAILTAAAAIGAIAATGIAHHTGHMANLLNKLNLSALTEKENQEDLSDTQGEDVTPEDTPSDTDGKDKVDPTPVVPSDPTPVDPTPVDPTPVDPTPVDPTPVDPTPVDPTPVDPTPVDPTPVDPTPVDPTPFDPTPVDPTPVDPTPIEPENPVTGLPFHLDDGESAVDLTDGIEITRDGSTYAENDNGDMEFVERQELKEDKNGLGVVEEHNFDIELPSEPIVPETGNEITEEEFYEKVEAGDISEKTAENYEAAIEDFDWEGFFEEETEGMSHTP